MSSGIAAHQFLTCALHQLRECHAVCVVSVRMASQVEMKACSAGRYPLRYPLVLFSLSCARSYA
jgi:hypothetical protein